MTHRLMLVGAAVWALAGVAGAAAPTVNVSDGRIVEGDAGLRTLSVLVTLSDAAPGAVTVAYATRDRTAAASDYTSTSGTLTFAQGETSKRISLPVIGDTAVEPDETFEVVLGTVSGATVGRGIGTATIVNDDFAAAQGRAIYEVRFSFQGYSGSMAGSDCPGVRRNGTVVMSGLLSGDERDAENDVEYAGQLAMDLDVDLCEAKQTRDGDEFCRISVVGALAVHTQLTVPPVDQTGQSVPPSWVKVRSASAAPPVSISGTCPGAALAGERASFPDNSYANVFTAQELKIPAGRLRVGRYTDGDMTLEVLRVVRRAP